MAIDKPAPPNALPPDPLQGLTLTTDMSDLAEELRPLLALWESRRQNGGFPARSNLSPRDLKPWLASIHAYEMADNDHFTARLLGTAIVGAIGQDQTGRTFGPTHTDLLATRAHSLLSAVLRERRPIWSSAPRIASVKQSWHAVESLWLPCGEGQAIQQILAATVLTQID